MADCVVKFDHLAIQIKGIGDIHGLAQDKVAKCTRNACLPVSRRSVHENGCSRIKCRPKPLEGRFRDHELGQDLTHRARRHAQASAFLAADGLVVDFEWHRRRPGILTALQRLAGM